MIETTDYDHFLTDAQGMIAKATDEKERGWLRHAIRILEYGKRKNVKVLVRPKGVEYGILPKDLGAFRAFCIQQGWQEKSLRILTGQIVMDLNMMKDDESFHLCHTPNSKSLSPRGEKQQRKVGYRLIKEFRAHP